jgi:hypothetical protein
MRLRVSVCHMGVDGAAKGHEWIKAVRRVASDGVVCRVGLRGGPADNSGIVPSMYNFFKRESFYFQSIHLNDSILDISGFRKQCGIQESSALNS